ncbi:MAG: hypothetical protein JWN44_1101 [Myxococcales bacterium]|nr:hypothetical protein [Myxococcales bacterium]
MIRMAWKQTSSRAALITALGIMMAAPSVGHAAGAGACVPPATGAPWSGGAPTITDVSALGGLQWTGSFGFDWQAGATQKADFKFLVTKGSAVATEAGYLYFYWRQNIPTASVADEDGVRFGFTAVDPVSGKKVAQVYTINMQGNAASPTRLTQPKQNPPSATSVSQRIDVDDPKALGSPPWLSDPQYINTWLMPAADTPMGQPQFTWAITAKIPIKRIPGAGVNGGSIRLATSTGPGTGDLYDTATAGVFLDSNVVDPGTLMVAPATGIWSDLYWTPGSGTQAVLHYPDDIDGSVLPSDGSLPPVPLLSAFNSAQLVGPMDTLCSNGGVYITQDDIFTSSGSWAGDLHAYTSSATPVPSANSVLVQVHNKGGALTATDAAKIHATFRIAPLGSQNVKSNLWRELNTAGNKLLYSCPTPTTCGPSLFPAAPIAGNFVAGTLAGGATGQTFSVQTATPWTPDWSYICATYFDADPAGTPNGHFTAEYGYTRFPSNCAGGAAPWKPTLTPPSDGLGSHQCMLVELSSEDNRQFNQQSAFRNMHLGHASTFKETAIIDSSGLKRLGTATGRYMYIYVVKQNVPQVYVPPVDNPSLTRAKGIVVKDGLVFNASTRERLSYDQAAEFMPTVAYHVYNDSGRKQRSLSRKTFRVLEQQASYGFFIEHAGELHGWRTVLSGAEKLGPNFYRVWVKNNQSVPVTTVVEAREKECSGNAFAKTNRLLKQLETYLASIGSPYLDDVKGLEKKLQIQCVDLADFIAELKLQPGFECIGSLLDAILEASGCHC